MKTVFATTQSVTSRHFGIVCCCFVLTIGCSGSGVPPTQKIELSPAAPVTALAISTDGQILASGQFASLTNEGTLSLWDLRSGKKLADQKLGHFVPTALEFTDSDRHIVVGEASLVQPILPFDDSIRYRNNGAIKIFDVAPLHEDRSIDLTWSVYGLAIAPDEKHLAAVGGGADDKIRAVIVSTADGTRSEVLADDGPPARIARANPLRQLQFSHDGTKLLIASMIPSGSAKLPGIQVIDVSTGRSQSQWLFPESGVTWFDLDPADRSVAVIGRYGGSIWTIDDGWKRLNKEASVPNSPFRLLLNGKTRLYAIRKQPNEGPQLPFDAGITQIGDGAILTGFVGELENCSAFALNKTEQCFAIGDDQGHINVWKISSAVSNDTKPDTSDSDRSAGK